MQIFLVKSSAFFSSGVTKALDGGGSSHKNPSVSAKKAKSHLEASVSKYAKKLAEGLSCGHYKIKVNSVQVDEL